MSRSERSTGPPSCSPGRGGDYDDNDDLDDINDNDNDNDDDSNLCHKHLVEFLSQVEVCGRSISHCDHLDRQLRNVH